MTLSNLDPPPEEYPRRNTFDFDPEATVRISVTWPKVLAVVGPLIAAIGAAYWSLSEDVDTISNGLAHVEGMIEIITRSFPAN